MFTIVFWKKAWTWLKHYWYWPVILVLLAFSIVAGRSSREKLFGLLEKQKENYDKEIQIIKETSEEKEERKMKIFEEHMATVEDIEKEKRELIESLDDQKKEELKQVVEKNKNKPEDLARDVAKILSAAYHENNR